MIFVCEKFVELDENLLLTLLKIVRCPSRIYHNPSTFEDKVENSLYSLM